MIISDVFMPLRCCIKKYICMNKVETKLECHLGGVNLLFFSLCIKLKLKFVSSISLISYLGFVEKGLKHKTVAKH